MLIDPYHFISVSIENIRREAANAVSVRLALPNGYIYAPGQYAIVRVTVPDGTKLIRQYSFSSIISSGELWLTIVQVPNGMVSGWFVRTAKIGDTIEISRPFSGSLMHKTPRGKICMIAGGSGIAPLMAWTRTLRQEQRSFTLVYSSRRDTLCFFNELQPSRPNETIVIRRTDTEPRFSPGDIVQYVDADTTVYICGSHDFVRTMQGYCETVIPPAQIFPEAFTL